MGRCIKRPRRLGIASGAAAVASAARHDAGIRGAGGNAAFHRAQARGIKYAGNRPGTGIVDHSALQFARFITSMSTVSHRENISNIRARPLRGGH